MVVEHSSRYLSVTKLAEVESGPAVLLRGLDRLVVLMSGYRMSSWVVVLRIGCVFQTK